MLSKRLEPWMLIAALASCTPEPNRAPQGGTNPPESTPRGGGAWMDVGGGSESDGSFPDDGATLDATADATGDVPPVIIHEDAGGGAPMCANDVAALGSNRLLAAGATPSAFAAAYNAELAALGTAGPLLIALYGVNGAAPSRWVASLGALAPGMGGAGVGFAGGHASVPFALGSDRSLQIAPSLAAFGLKFGAPAGDALLPIVSVELTGALAVGCGSLTVTKAKLLVPAGAGGTPFHGSTVGALMGDPTESHGGVPNSAWALELSGRAQQVDAPGLAGDGGIEP